MTNQEWRNLCVSSADAVKCIHSGNRVFLGSNVAVPKEVVRALVERNRTLDDVEIVHILTTLDPEFADDISPDHFHHKTFFVGKDTRNAVYEGKADYIPVFLSEIPDLFRRGQMPIDVAIVQLSVPDEHGYCSYGVGVDITKAAAECANIVIAQINPCMPRTLGDSFIHIADVDYCVFHEEALDEVVYATDDPTSKKIGALVATLIENGSTLQMGIGGIPDCVLANLTQHKDIGIHTEMFSDGLLDLIESGVVSNLRKGFHDGKTISSFCMGSRRLYDFVHNNPSIEFHPSDYVNNPLHIAKNNRMISINSALEIDLSGQVCADSIGNKIYSGIGGQVDFVRGASMSYKGKSIIAMPSTAKHGELSRIKAQLTPGAGVVTSRGDVDYVVTEFGSAYLHGKSIRERAIALINIAHPDFRTSLYEDALSLNILHPHHVSPFSCNEYPAQHESTQTFKACSLQFRPIRSTDTRLLQEFFYSHNPETIYQRYHGMKMRLSTDEALSMSNVDYKCEMALVAVRSENEAEDIVAVARYIKNEFNNYAEMALVVHEDLRGQGVGRYMFSELRRIAKANNTKGFLAYVQPDNIPMLRLLEDSLHQKIRKGRLEDGVYRIKFDI